MTRFEHAADPVGTAGATLAALCCAGVSAVAGTLSAVGLGFVMTDLVLLPLLLGMLALSLWGLARGRVTHGTGWPLILGAAGAATLTIGVFTSRWILGLGAGLLLGATAWNVAARRRCEREARQVPSHGGE